MKDNKAHLKKKTTPKKPAKPAVRKAAKKSARVTKEAPGKVARIGIHNLIAPKGSHKRRKYLGRGSSSGHGKTSTRGSKGQTSRAGRDFYLGFEGGQTPLIRRIPKRGFTNIFKKKYQIVNLSDLNKIKELTINLELLKAKGLIKDKSKLVKILGDGDIKNAFTIQAHAFSRKATEKIKNAGGRIEVVNV